MKELSVSALCSGNYDVYGWYSDNSVLLQESGIYWRRGFIRSFM